MPTLEPDDDGYYPAPPPELGIHYQVLALDDSPHADLLVPLQDELDRRDAAALAARVEEGGGVAMTGRLRASSPDSWADAELTERNLAAFFEQGSQPQVQGYFEVPNAAGERFTCVEVLITGWTGDVAIPTPRPGAMGPRPPESIPEGHSSWHMCRGATEGEWDFLTWRWDSDSYLGAVARRYVDRYGPYSIVRPGMTAWPVDMPAGEADGVGYALDVPAGSYVSPGADAHYFALDSCDWWGDPDAAAACDPERDTMIQIAPHDRLGTQSMKVTLEEAKAGAEEVVLEERWTLEDGAPAVRLVLREEPLGERNLLLTVLGGHVVVASSRGDPAAFDTVVRSLRPAADALLP